MISEVFYILITLGIIFLILSILWESITFGVMDVVVWMTAAAACYQFRIPYQYVAGGVPNTAYHVIEDNITVSWLFMLFAIIAMIHTMILGFDMLKGRVPKVM